MITTTPTGRPVKHGCSAYKRYGCRCDVCVAAKRASRKAWQLTEGGKASARRKHLRRKYAMTTDDYAHLLESQGGRCALCDKGESEVLLVDHCHETGRIRGLLCRACNVQLGKWGDNEAGIRRVLDYVTNP